MVSGGGRGGQYDVERAGFEHELLRIWVHRADVWARHVTEPGRRGVTVKRTVQTLAVTRERSSCSSGSCRTRIEPSPWATAAFPPNFGPVDLVTPLTNLDLCRSVLSMIQPPQRRRPALCWRHLAFRHVRMKP